MSKPTHTNPHQPTDHPDPPPATQDAAAQPIDPWEQYFSDLDEALQHASTQERRSAVTNLLPMLVHLDHTRATEVLVHLLNDHDTYVRLIAALDLAKAGNDRGFTTLIQLFSHVDRIERVEIIEALGKVTTSQSVHFLIAALQDTEPSVDQPQPRHWPTWPTTSIMPRAFTVTCTMPYLPCSPWHWPTSTSKPMPPQPAR